MKKITLFSGAFFVMGVTILSIILMTLVIAEKTNNALITGIALITIGAIIFPIGAITTYRLIQIADI